MLSRAALLFVIVASSSCMQTRAAPATPAPTAGAWVAGGGAATRVLAANDPITTDGDKYRVILENDQVRVLRYQDKPGAKTHSHYHARFVLYALGPFQRRLTFGNGTTKTRGFRTGDVIYMPAQTHIGENIGTTDTDVLIVEIKTPSTAAAKH